MKVLYDQQIFSFQEYGGISRYFYELAKGIQKTNNCVLIDGRFSNNVYLSKIKKGTMNVLPQIDFPHKNLAIFYLNNIFDSKNLKDGNFDIFHASYFHPYFLNKLRGRPYIITVYDMIPELFAKDFKGINDKTLKYKKETIFKANHIIAISENTKEDLIKLYGVPKDRINVICLGNPLENAVPSRIENLPNKYLLFVGNRSGYKNFNFFVKSIVPILRDDKNLFLTCAGGGEFSAQETALFSELKITNKVKHINFRDDNELAYIYQHALVYILPSLYEGFGITALEAFSMGCPVVASKTSSIPEVCGKAVEYVNPKDSVSIEKGVNEVVNHNKLRQNLVNLGFAQAKGFSWKKTVAETIKVYQKCISNNN